MKSAVPMNSGISAWKGMLPVEDTALAVSDSGGSGIPVIYLNGQFAIQGNWKGVMAELGPGFRHILFDERARGGSETSGDYSFSACLRDIDAVLAARGIEKSLLVGWSYGAFLAAHWASLNPERALGAALVDGAQPFDWLDEAMERHIRNLFRRMGWFMPLLRPIGLLPKMSPARMADCNIELGKLARAEALGPVLDRIRVPTRYVVASGSSFGSKEEDLERIRASLGRVAERNGTIKISAKVSSTHDTIVFKDYRAIADAVREVAGLARG
jgi:pimeloyl-ACP methyl ester carboxylesterase